MPSRTTLAKGGMDSGFVATLLSIGVIASFLLGAGGMWLLVKRRDTKRGLLMLGVAAVTIANVLILVLPVPGR